MTLNYIHEQKNLQLHVEHTYRIVDLAYDEFVWEMQIDYFLLQYQSLTSIVKSLEDPLLCDAI